MLDGRGATGAADIDVRLEQVGKRYRLGSRAGAEAECFWALRDISCEVRRGSTFGIIGRNGAGKSTLLKLLSGITAPTVGRITIHGRLAALIEVGSGFHPELTGRENVFLSGAILGMRRREIAAKLDRIFAFAGVERFADTPVKWYSSGMYVRLGFAIAAHLEPDILLVDEVLAVGDAEFQLKCLERIDAMRRQGVTVIFISHDLTAVERLCDTVLLLEGGRARAIGPAAEVVGLYHRQLTAAQRAGDVWQAGESSAAGQSGPVPAAVRVTNLTMRTAESGRVAACAGEPLTVELRLEVTDPVGPVKAVVTFYGLDGRTPIARLVAQPVVPVAPATTVEFVCESLALAPGAYYVGAVVREQATDTAIDWWDGGTLLHVGAGSSGGGPFELPHRWRAITTDRTIAAFGDR